MERRTQAQRSPEADTALPPCPCSSLREPGSETTGRGGLRGQTRASHWHTPHCRTPAGSPARPTARPLGGGGGGLCCEYSSKLQLSPAWADHSQTRRQIQAPLTLPLPCSEQLVELTGENEHFPRFKPQRARAAQWLCHPPCPRVPWGALFGGRPGQAGRARPAAPSSLPPPQLPFPGAYLEYPGQHRGVCIALPQAYQPPSRPCSATWKPPQVLSVGLVGLCGTPAWDHTGMRPLTSR